VWRPYAEHEQILFLSRENLHLLAIPGGTMGQPAHKDSHLIVVRQAFEIRLPAPQFHVGNGLERNKGMHV
jgi:hypothetical protein